VRIHLGHHFYGAGNLGDDFMLAGFFHAMETLAPDASFSCCVPFPLEPLRARFPRVNWQPYDDATRAHCIGACDVWLGLGGSPFQHALSRWFLVHLLGEARLCAAAKKPMFYLGIGVQTRDEARSPDVQRLCAQALAIWTRDPESAENLAALPSSPPIAAAADFAHILFRHTPPPPARTGQITLVPNFDYGAWPGRDALLRATGAFRASRRVWLAQEARTLPGAERALYSALPIAEQSRWQIIMPDAPGAPLPQALARWPSGEWLITSRYHAALAGAWAGSKIVVIATNEKLRAAARELGCSIIMPDTDAATVSRVLATAERSRPGTVQAAAAQSACAAFVEAASRRK
jgi:polysaccharide pyruvyl transferase WcaK-like protein